MSSLFSDPPFQRGSTLLGGEAVEYIEKDGTYAQDNSTGTPASGAEIVGQIKVFADVHPVTKAKLSNELVYCVAARYKPSTATNLNASGADRGKAVVLRVSSATGSAEFTDTFATNANVTAGQRVAFIDEYLTTTVRPNDIVWLVLKGPCAVRKTTSAAINAGALVTITSTAGRVVTASSVLTLTEAAPNTLNQVGMGIACGSVDTSTNAVVYGANAASSDEFSRALLYGVNWAA